MTLELTAVQIGVWVELRWTDDGFPNDLYNLYRDVDGGGEATFASVIESDDIFVDTDVAVGQSIVYRVENNITLDSDTATVVLADPSEPFTYGQVNPLATEPRYTTVAKVKELIGPTAPAKDERIKTAIVASEIQIDQTLHRSFPDTGSNPEIAGVPLPIVQAATNIAVAVFKAGDSPFGVAGSDEFIGTISVADETRREFAGNPMLYGYRVGFGIA